MGLKPNIVGQSEPLGVQIFREAYDLSIEMDDLAFKLVLLRDSEDFINKGLGSQDIDSGLPYLLCSMWGRLMHKMSGQMMPARSLHSLAGVYLIMGLIQPENLKEFHTKGISIILYSNRPLGYFPLSDIHDIFDGKYTIEQITSEFIDYMDNGSIEQIVLPAFFFLNSTSKYSEALWGKLLEMVDGKVDITFNDSNQLNLASKINSDMKKLYFGI